MMSLQRNEKVKDVKGYEGLYAVTSLGRIWSHRRNKYIKTHIDSNGYMRATFSVDNKQASFKLHRLVGLSFVDNPLDKPQINHKNGNKTDCRVCNLEWVTARENLQHACDIGLNSCFKLSYAEKMLVCKYYSEGKKQNKIASMFEVTPPAIHYIIREYTPHYEANHSL